eukprot:TRINITY_DN5451_c0_g1_i1.p2 TRINITY_DN5451_c0_g1~~TRINITY_DN5451_c0_g1_i1.p2  ORF type:complete len:176 (+),score=42.59 TRINITY_DN5451_c0_g1_i1:70-597(+)
MPSKKFNDAANHFQMGLFETCYLSPLECMTACVCPCCYAYRQRLTIWELDPQDYVCCGGAYCGFDCYGKKCPYFCLCVEVWLCCWCSIFGSRYLIQSMYQIRNTAFEVFVIWTMCICAIITCILSCFLPDLWSWWMDCICDGIYCALSACFQTQQQAELNYRKKNTTSSLEMNQM